MTRIVTRQSRKTGAAGAFLVATILMAVVGFAKWGPKLARIQDSQEREWQDRQQFERILNAPPLTTKQVEQLDKSAKIFLDNLHRDLEERGKTREAESLKPTIETPPPSANEPPKPAS